MKFIKWKILIVTSIVCLLPILLGLSLWEKLPDTMAIHFDLNNNPDNFASKGFVVFGMPCLMVVLQWICCLINDINEKKHGSIIKFERVAKGIIPFTTVLLYLTTLGIGLGWDIDVRAVAAFIVGVIFILMGICLPKLDYIKNYDLSPDKARKINRFAGFETVILGVLFLISILLPPISTVICLALLIPCTLLGIIYGIKVRKGN